MHRNLHCDWLLDRVCAEWRYLARSGFPAVSRKKSVSFKVADNSNISALQREASRDPPRGREKAHNKHGGKESEVFAISLIFSFDVKVKKKTFFLTALLQRK